MTYKKHPRRMKYGEWARKTQERVAGEQMKKYTLQEKMKKSYILFFAVILVAITVVMYLISSRVYWNKSWALCEQLVSLNLDLLNNQAIEVQNQQEMVAKNDEVKKAVQYYNNAVVKDYDKELKIRRKLDEVFYLYARNNMVSSAYIIDSQGRYLYFYRESPKVGYNMLEQEWYSTLIDEIYMDTCYVSGIHERTYLVNDSDELCISFIRPIQYEERYIFSADAYLVCDISLDFIFSSSNDDDSMKFAILDREHEIYAGDSLGLTLEEQERVIADAKEQDVYVSTMHTSPFESSIVVSMKSYIFGWKMIGVKNLDEINDMRILVLLILIGTIIITMILVAFLSKRVARTLLQPMDLLVEECNRVAGGDYGVEFQDKQSEEISFLSDTIQDMVNNVVALSDKIVEEERKLSDEKLRVLQHQINPHFLNNVLQTIKALAVEGETDKVSRITTLLGHILAYSVYEPYENVELRMELESLKQYIELQNIRYNNRIICSIDCEEVAGRVQIPKLTLQPLAENSINHGLKEKGTLMINVSTDIEKDVICIIISDNGQGIQEKELEELKASLEPGETYTKKSSIGVANVNERLRRIYGKDYGIRIYSRYNHGTTVIIYIPKEGVSADESIISR